MGGKQPHQTVNRDLSCLSQAVTPVLRLAVNLWVEVNVMQDNSVCARQVEALPASARAHQEREHRVWRGVEAVPPQAC